MVTQVWNLAKMWKDTKVTLTLFSIWSTDYLKPKISETLEITRNSVNHFRFFFAMGSPSDGASRFPFKMQLSNSMFGYKKLFQSSVPLSEGKFWWTKSWRPFWGWKHLKLCQLQSEFQWHYQHSRFWLVFSDTTWSGSSDWTCQQSEEDWRYRLSLLQVGLCRWSGSFAKWLLDHGHEWDSFCSCFPSNFRSVKTATRCLIVWPELLCGMGTALIRRQSQNPSTSDFSKALPLFWTDHPFLHLNSCQSLNCCGWCPCCNRFRASHHQSGWTRPMQGLRMRGIQILQWLRMNGRRKIFRFQFWFQHWRPLFVDSGWKGIFQGLCTLRLHCLLWDIFPTWKNTAYRLQESRNRRLEITDLIHLSFQLTSSCSPRWSSQSGSSASE